MVAIPRNYTGTLRENSVSVPGRGGPAGRTTSPAYGYLSTPHIKHHHSSLCNVLVPLLKDVDVSGTPLCGRCPLFTTLVQLGSRRRGGYRCVLRGRETITRCLCHVGGLPRLRAPDGRLGEGDCRYSWDRDLVEEPHSEARNTSWYTPTSHRVDSGHGITLSPCRSVPWMSRFRPVPCPELRVPYLPGRGRTDLTSGHTKVLAYERLPRTLGKNNNNKPFWTFLSDHSTYTQDSDPRVIHRRERCRTLTTESHRGSDVSE